MQSKDDNLGRASGPGWAEGEAGGRGIVSFASELDSNGGKWNRQADSGLTSTIERASNRTTAGGDTGDWNVEGMSMFPKRGHRRSISDSLSFPTFSNTTEDETFLQRSGPQAGGDFSQLNDDQLLSMFMDVNTIGFLNPNMTHAAAAAAAAAAGAAGLTPGQALKESLAMPPHDAPEHLKNIFEMGTASMPVSPEPDDVPDSPFGLNSTNNDPEGVRAGAVGASAPTSPVEADTGGKAKTSGSSQQLDLSTLDPKRAKRILANRLSAQRSRMRKLHYITGLEQNVAKLGAEMARLTPKLAALKTKYNESTVANIELKTSIERLLWDSKLKEALNERLVGELEKLNLSPFVGKAAATDGAVTQSERLDFENVRVKEELPFDLERRHNSFIK